jgi:sugar O-acyltransferase (sialic acid O-acetyltransferase NeuD family)
MTDCVVIGAGTYGEVYAAYLSQEYNVIGFIDDDLLKHGTFVQGIPVLGGKETLIGLYGQGLSNAFVPIGNNRIRTQYLEFLQHIGFKTPSFIHPASSIHDSVYIGNAVYILPGTSIMPFTQISDMCMISMGVNVAHHCVVQKGVFLSQGVNVGASIRIEDFSFIGIGATIMTGVSNIGRNSLVGGGAVVIKDVPENAVMVGNPSRILKYQ